jgi:hypothetical protein
MMPIKIVIVGGVAGVIMLDLPGIFCFSDLQHINVSNLTGGFLSFPL